MAKIYLKRKISTSKIPCEDENGTKCYCVQKYKNETDRLNHLFICNNENSKIRCNGNNGERYIFIEVKRPD